jgi:hypothetical protein
MTLLKRTWGPASAETWSAFTALTTNLSCRSATLPGNLSDPATYNNATFSSLRVMQWSARGNLHAPSRSGPRALNRPRLPSPSGPGRPACRSVRSSWGGAASVTSHLS